jgi:alkanesulfonate monooxygenase SsuD/methylene tetrahydromethanopterin reductase-like flavin-dependent oxidoreductase (luciferase family)
MIEDARNRGGGDASPPSHITESHHARTITVSAEKHHNPSLRPAPSSGDFCGGPDEIVAQLQRAREQIGCGVVDLSFQTPGSEDPDELMEALELFGKKVLPHIRDI